MQAAHLPRVISALVVLTVKPALPARSDVLVVIPCLNEQSYIGRVISTVLRDRGGHRLAVVVADGGSTDATCRIVSEIAAQDSRVRLISNPARIQSAGINRAVRLFGREYHWLLRMDAHAEYPDDYVSVLVAEAERTGAASVVVAMKARGSGYLQRAAAEAQNSFLGAGGSPHRGDGPEGFVDHGHHALIALEQFCVLGGYDENQTHNEDAEFDTRLVQAGGKIWLTRATQVTYFPRSRARDLFLQYRNHGCGRAMTMLRHRMRPKPRQLLPACVAPGAMLAALAPLDIFFALPAVLWVAACATFGIVLGLKERSLPGFAAGGAAAIMHLGWSLGFWTTLLKRFAQAPHRKIVAPAGR